jgi:energy-coupling factor transporter ATP-binding protein EcfA2
MEIFSLEDLTFTYPNAGRPALSSVSFAAGRSDFVVLCGRSGCGKSTLLRLMKPELAPHGELRGKISFCGVPLGELGERQSAAKIGFVQQDPEAQTVTDKVWHELAFGLESLGTEPCVIRRRVAEMAAFFGIESWFRRDVNSLSGGQKQLLNLASVMAMQPEVLLLDEPTSQLDPIAASNFIAAVGRINRELGTTVIMSEHRLEEVLPIADSLVVMESGTISDSGPARQVGRRLCAQGESSPMFRALPAAMRICAGVEPGGDAPVTVREGREWLSAAAGTAKLSQDCPPPRPAPAGHGEAVKLEEVFFRYGKNSQDILRGMSLSVEYGEMCCIVGGNGAGKSTAVKVMSGVLRPWRGKVSAGGSDGSRGRDSSRRRDDSRRRDSSRRHGGLISPKLGVLPQDPMSIFSEQDAESELAEALESSGAGESEIKIKAEKMLERMELGHLRAANPADLSGGEKQRLALGKILMLEPEILLLDEPTKGIDPFFKAELGELLKKLKDSGAAIIAVTHDIEFCAEYADTCAMLFDGSIAAKAPAREFFAGNSFYTTAADRISRGIFRGAVTCGEVTQLCRLNLKKG